MIRLRALLLAAVMCLSFVFVSSSVANAETNSLNSPRQIVPTAKRITGKTYRKSRHITKASYRKGRKISKKSWKKGKHIGQKTGRKTKHIVVGEPKRRTP